VIEINDILEIPVPFPLKEQQKPVEPSNEENKKLLQPQGMKIFNLEKLLLSQKIESN
jgi:hypothetical protein